MKKKLMCPRCGSIEIHTIRSGWPEPELGGKMPREGPLGRRLLGIDNPDRVCTKCGHQWSSSPVGKPRSRSR